MSEAYKLVIGERLKFHVDDSGSGGGGGDGGGVGGNGGGGGSGLHR